MTAERSSEEIAAILLRSTSLQALRREVGSSKAWAKAFGGFRPQSLTHPMAAGKSAVFARDPVLMRSLAAVYLKSIGVPEPGSMEARLAAVAGRVDLPEDVRAACAQLAGSAGTAAPVEPASEPVPAEPPAPPLAAAAPVRRRAAPKAE